MERNSRNDFNSIVNEIEEEGYRHLNNEIEVSDDGYVHDAPLLAGLIDENGVLHNTFTYREMNGKDEEAISKADVKSNGAKVVNVLVERCVSEIGTLKKKELGAKWGETVRKLLGGDLDYIAFKIRELSKGKEITFSHKCPNCGTTLNTVASIDEFPIKPFLGNFEVEFELPRGYKDAKGELHTTGVIRMSNGLDREVVTPILKKNASTATTVLITRLIKFNDGCIPNQNYVSEMSLRDRDVLEKIIKDNVFGIDTNLDIVCSSCGADISGELGQSNFF